MNAIRTTRHSRPGIFRGLSREEFSSPGVTPAKPLRVAPDRTEDATLRYPAVSSLFRVAGRTAAAQSAVTHRPRAVTRAQRSSPVTLGCVVPGVRMTRVPRIGGATISTFWRYAKMTLRERVAKFAHTDAVPSSAPSRHSRSIARQLASYLPELSSAINSGTVRRLFAKIVE